MKNQSRLFRRVGVSLAAIGALLSAGSTLAATPYTADDLKVRQDALTNSVKRGYDMWYGARADMANNGLACANCHPDAAATNPQTFPKFLPMFNKVVTYRAMVNWCIQNPQGGKLMDVNSDDMTALEAYSFYLHKGTKIETGLVTRQTAGAEPASARGFNVKGTGIGFDK